MTVWKKKSKYNLNVHVLFGINKWTYVTWFQASSCENGSVYAGSCYVLATGTGTWTAAQADCATFGYHLVTITSAEENQFVTDLVKTVYNGKHGNSNRFERKCS